MELGTLEAMVTMVFRALGVSIVSHRCVSSPAPLPVKRIPLVAPDYARMLEVIMRRDYRNRHKLERLEKLSLLPASPGR